MSINSQDLELFKPIKILPVRVLSGLKISPSARVFKCQQNTPARILTIVLIYTYITSYLCRNKNYSSQDCLYSYHILCRVIAKDKKKKSSCTQGSWVQLKNDADYEQVNDQTFSTSWLTDPPPSVWSDVVIFGGGQGRTLIYNLEPSRTVIEPLKERKASAERLSLTKKQALS